MKPKLVKNFLEPAVFKKVQDDIASSYFPWFYQDNVAYESRAEKKTFCFTHMFYRDNERSQSFDFIKPILEQLDIKSLIRAKANFFPNQGKQYLHPMHNDFPYKHKGFLFSLNTTDGYTLFEDGTKIIGRENQGMHFNPLVPHRSTSPTDAKRRINININYF